MTAEQEKQHDSIVEHYGLVPLYVVKENMPLYELKSNDAYYFSDSSRYKNKKEMSLNLNLYANAFKFNRIKNKYLKKISINKIPRNINYFIYGRSIHKDYNKRLMILIKKSLKIIKIEHEPTKNSIEYITIMDAPIKNANNITLYKFIEYKLNNTNCCILLDGKVYSYNSELLKGCLRHNNFIPGVTGVHTQNIVDNPLLIAIEEVKANVVKNAYRKERKLEKAHLWISLINDLKSKK